MIMHGPADAGGTCTVTSRVAKRWPSHPDLAGYPARSVAAPTRDTGSEGIYHAELDIGSGELTVQGVAARADNPAFLALGDLAERLATIAHEGSSVNPERQQEPHPHSVNLSPDGNDLSVPDQPGPPHGCRWRMLLPKCEGTVNSRCTSDSRSGSRLAAGACTPVAAGMAPRVAVTGHPV